MAALSAPAVPLIYTRLGLADALQISTRTLDRMLCTGRLPRPVRFGRKLGWRREEVERWLAAGCPSQKEWIMLEKRPANSKRS